MHRSATRNGMYGGKRWIPITAIILIFLVFSALLLQNEWSENRNWWTTSLENSVNAVNFSLENGYSKSLAKAVGMLTGYYETLDVICLDTDTFEHTGIPQSQGKTIWEAGYTYEILTPGSHLMRHPDGSLEKVYTSLLHYEDTTLALVLSYNRNAMYLSVSQMVLAFLAAVLLLYIHVIEKKAEIHRTEDEQSKKTSQQRLYRSQFSLTVVFSIFVLLVYAASYLAVSFNAMLPELEIATDYGMETIRSRTAAKNNRVRFLDEFARIRTDEICEKLSKTNWNSIADGPQITWYTSGEGLMRTPVLDDQGQAVTAMPRSGYLQDLCRDYSFQRIQIFDNNGYCVASSDDVWHQRLSFAEDSPDKPFTTVLEQIEPSAIVNEETDDGMITTAARFLTMTRGTDTRDYLLLVRGFPDPSVLTDEEILDSSLRLLQDGFYVGVTIVRSDAEHTIWHMPDQFANCTLEEIGLPGEAFSTSRYVSIFKHMGRSYLQYVRYFNNFLNRECYISAANNLRAVICSNPFVYFGHCWIYLFAGFLLISLVLTLVSPEMASRMCMPYKGSENSPRHHYSQQTASQRFRTATFFVLGISFVALLLYTFINYVLFTDRKVSFLFYLASYRWQRGLNLLAILAAAVIIFVTTCVFLLGRQLFLIISPAFTLKSNTILKMIFSLFKYLGIIAAALVILWCFGMDIGGLLTSLGIFSLIMGLAAQDLIKDIIAGGTIVFEGLFQIGDMLVIGDVTGTVVGISLRSCQIQTYFNEVMTIRNTAIVNFLNLSKKLNILRVTCPMPQTVPPDVLEEMLQKELPGIRERLSGFVSNLTYKGVASYQLESMEAPASYTVIFDAQSLLPPKENDPIKRKIIREILLVCTRYGYFSGNPK